MARKAKYNIGDIVTHAVQGYRAVVVDVDPQFQASGHYNPQASKRPFATKNPWYRLLIDHSSQETYVEECHLKKDSNQETIDNPQIGLFLTLEGDRYHSNASVH